MLALPRRDAWRGNITHFLPHEARAAQTQWQTWYARWRQLINQYHDREGRAEVSKDQAQKVCVGGENADKPPKSPQWGDGDTLLSIPVGGSTGKGEVSGEKIGSEEQLPCLSRPA